MLPTVVTDLPRLARRIDECHFQVQYHAKGMLLEAKQAGEYLLEAKKLCPHGTFKDWVSANCRCSYRTAAKYMQVARKCADHGTFDADAGVDAFLEAHAKPRPEEPTQAAPAPASSFTREDAEYALKIHARVERGQDGERDVAATKLAKVAEGFGMDPEALVAKAQELCPGAGFTDSERRAQEAEAQLEALKAEVARRRAVVAEVAAKFKDASKEELITMIGDWKARGLLTAEI
ncbi:DUF3102 domain-containing protein [Azospirillum sp. 412522]|nr:DUF3102 domain-containing protein [Azospirillum sp. 412522]MBY6265108.1 DUF3102 domain-containing protein [Azospirillum sp. 412522]